MVRLGLLLAVVIAAGGCTFAGPAAIRGGRSVYSAAINATENEQILSIIVRQRYDETFDMLAVSSITASIRLGGSVGANAGIGPESGYQGNLVPLSAGATYEENPTISYVPVRGERFVERMLAPITAEHAVLLSRMSTGETEVLRFLIRRASGLANPLYAPGPSNADFDRFIDLWAHLRDAGMLDIVRSDKGDDTFQMLLHDYGGDGQSSADADELLRLVGLGGPISSAASRSRSRSGSPSVLMRPTALISKRLPPSRSSLRPHPE